MSLSSLPNAPAAASVPADLAARAPHATRTGAGAGATTAILSPLLAALFARPYRLLAVILAAVMAPAWVSTDLLVVGGDVLVIHYPWFVLWRDALAAGEFPFWNPYSFTGIPAFATLQAGYGYPPHWLLTPLPAILAINWLVALHVILAGLGAAYCAEIGRAHV